MIAPESLAPGTRPTINKSWRLDPGEYKPQASQKDLICLHHTVGGTAWSTFAWWRQDPRAIATAYIVARDGIIYEVFPPDCWAWHLGVKDEKIERRSIGIELASEGGLTCRREDGTYQLYAFDGKRKLGAAAHLKRTNQAVRFDDPWRGYRWFDTYEPAQIQSTIALVLHLCERFNIPKKIPTPEECRSPQADLRRWFHHSGVLHHAMLRQDKSDLHPAFPFETLRTTLEAA